jgi:diadenosine tetraphosphate (Ap4A) HIT family hydrolase
VTTRRIVETWFDASDEEQAALMALVKEAKQLLDLRLSPKPDGYNVGFNSGAASGQTVPHVHLHVIPRYHGDMPDPRGAATTLRGPINAGDSVLTASACSAAWIVLP